VSDRHYLLKVLGLSAIPRLGTSCLKLVSYPLMVRALGASELGVVVYIGAVIAVLESFVDFGVSSAAGKEIAVAREASSVSLSLVIQKWARLQTIVALIGLGPLLGATYLVASAGSDIGFSLQVLVILVFAAWITISLNFVRACLGSMLAFKSLAALDVFDSIFRSLGWIAVAYLMPSTLGLALANIIAVGCVSVLGVTILWRVMDEHKAATVNSSNELLYTHSALHIRNMLTESLNFLWLRLVTRVFQSIPIMLFGRMFGSEVVGVVGAFAKIIDMIIFPFGVIGNALAVRAPGVMVKGLTASKLLWDAASRFIAVSLMFSLTIYLGAELLAQLLLPNSHGAGSFLAILSITVMTTAISSLIAPMSDYVGALRSRNILLTFFVFVQIPLIWLGGKTFGAMGALIAYVVILLLMNCGYVIISLKAFFPDTHYRLRPEVRSFLAIVAAALLLTFFLHKVTGLDHLLMLQPFNAAFLEMAIFCLCVLVGLLLHQTTKAFFLTRTFFDFQA